MWWRRRRTPEELYQEARRLDLLGHDERALALFEQAADAGHGPACNQLGKRRIRAGATIEGLRWLRRAVDADVPEAALNLAAVHTRRGQRAKADELRARAEPGLLAAADAGDPDAAIALRRLYRDRGAADEADALLVAAQARARSAGDPETWCGVGTLLDDAGRTTEAEPWWRRAAEAGHVESMYLLGSVLQERGDAEAPVWLRRAAGAGNAHAMGALAQQAHHRGEEQAGVRWLRKAARAGNAAAMSNLAAIHRQHGEYEEAARWYRRASAAGDPHAAQRMETLHEETDV